jgi:hypothetical protein
MLPSLPLAPDYAPPLNWFFDCSDPEHIRKADMLLYLARNLTKRKVIAALGQMLIIYSTLFSKFVKPVMICL